MLQACLIVAVLRSSKVYNPNVMERTTATSMWPFARLPSMSPGVGMNLFLIYIFLFIRPFLYFTKSGIHPLYNIRFYIKERYIVMTSFWCPHVFEDWVVKTDRHGVFS
jgi:hypothetical protein